jgi:hypothetical protein
MQGRTYMALALDCFIFCDDIREEKGNKMTLVGLYGTDLLLPPGTKFPTAVRQLCIFVRFRGTWGGEKFYLDMDYNGESIIKPEQPSLLQAPKKEGEFVNASFYLVPFPMKGFGKYHFKIFLESREMLFADSILSVEPEPKAD